MLEFLEQNSIDYKVVFFFFFSTQLILQQWGLSPSPYILKNIWSLKLSGFL